MKKYITRAKSLLYINAISFSYIAVRDYISFMYVQTFIGKKKKKLLDIPVVFGILLCEIIEEVGRVLNLYDV